MGLAAVALLVKGPSNSGNNSSTNTADTESASISVPSMSGQPGEFEIYEQFNQTNGHHVLDQIEVYGPDEGTQSLCVDYYAVYSSQAGELVDPKHEPYILPLPCKGGAIIEYPHFRPGQWVELRLVDKSYSTFVAQLGFYA